VSTLTFAQVRMASRMGRPVDQIVTLCARAEIWRTPGRGDTDPEARRLDAEADAAAHAEVIADYRRCYRAARCARHAEARRLEAAEAEAQRWEGIVPASVTVTGDAEARQRANADAEVAFQLRRDLDELNYAQLAELAELAPLIEVTTALATEFEESAALPFRRHGEALDDAEAEAKRWARALCRARRGFRPRQVFDAVPYALTARAVLDSLGVDADVDARNTLTTVETGPAPPPPIEAAATAPHRPCAPPPPRVALLVSNDVAVGIAS